VAGGAFGANQPDGSASSFVEKLAEDAIDVLSAPDVAQPEQQKILSGLMRESFDTELIARFVVGSHWDAATPEQRREYLTLFDIYFVQVYSGLLSGYGGETLSVTGQEQLNDTDALVSARINGTGQPFDAGLRVRARAEGFQIIDIVVDNISMLSAHRSEFISVIKRQGFDGLIDVLKEQTEKLGGAT
jgi:phospholipid transport system substrate-binding protein